MTLLEESEAQAERYTRKLMDVMPDQVEGFQQAAKMLIDIRTGQMKLLYKKLLLVDGEPIPQPAA